MDELENRLRRRDPLPPEWSPEPPDGPRARALLEHVMSTPVLEPTDESTARRSPRRRWWWLGAFAAAIVLVVGGVLLANRGGGSEEQAVAFQLPGADAALQMCLAVTDYVPDPAAQAFSGTVTGVDAAGVTLDVDHWYTTTSEQADVVNLTAGTDVSVALDGVEFVEGQRYLVTVVNGEVQICGVSAPASPELEALYGQWYGS
jgi:hypothetical protein